MTTEARLAFVLFFFAVWCFFGLMAWAGAAVVVRGRGALPALPLALATASAVGVAVPLVGLDDLGGFFLSLATAFLGGVLGSAAGIGMARRFGVDGLSTDSARRGVVRRQTRAAESDAETD